MALNTYYLGTSGPGQNYQGSAASTVVSDLSISGKLDCYDADVTNDLAVTADLTSGTIAATTTFAAGASTFSSTASVAGLATFNAGALFANSIVTVTPTTPLSLTTAANFNDMTIGQVRLVFTSSGLSLGYSSGNSLYDIGSNSSAAQPTS